MPQNTIEEKVIAFLQQEETDYAAAAKLGSQALPVLKNIIMSQDERLASKATWLASMIPGDKKEALKEAAGHASVVVRVAAASASKQLTPEEAEPILQQLVNDTDVGVSKFTLQSIKAKNLSSKFRTSLTDISERNPNEAIKAMAADVLKSAK